MLPFLFALIIWSEKHWLGELLNQTEVIYISPLKALTNDIQKNLLSPLNEITDMAKARGLVMQDIQVAVRTGDTLARERQAMLRRNCFIN